MDRMPIKTNPRLFDVTVGRLQKQIGERIEWLDHVFGLCEHLVTIKDGKRFRSANVYVGKEKYERIEPCKELGNFCFFSLRDPMERVGRSGFTAPFYAVFWYNVDKVSSSPDEHNREAVKEEILTILNDLHVPGVEWGNVYEKPENVFNEFSYDPTGNQFLMAPYSGIRIEGRMRANVACYETLHPGDFNKDFNEDFSI